MHLLEFNLKQRDIVKTRCYVDKLTVEETHQLQADKEREVVYRETERNTYGEVIKLFYWLRLTCATVFVFFYMFPLLQRVSNTIHICLQLLVYAWSPTRHVTNTWSHSFQYKFALR